MGALGVTSAQMAGHPFVCQRAREVERSPCSLLPASHGPIKLCPDDLFALASLGSLSAAGIGRSAGS